MTAFIHKLYQKIYPTYFVYLCNIWYYILIKEILRPVDGAESMLNDAIANGYGMERDLVDPSVTKRVSSELRKEGLLRDLVELEPTSMFKEKGMIQTRLLHRELNDEIAYVEGRPGNFLPFFSVRVFEAGTHATTIHRNHPCIGPWAVGIVLNGESPFNVYRYDELKDDEVIPLCGDGNDPEPLDSIDTREGSGWTLYTRDELVPHSGGLVTSPNKRELIIFYDCQNDIE